VLFVVSPDEFFELSAKYDDSFVFVELLEEELEEEGEFFPFVLLLLADEFVDNGGDDITLVK
jgi:hypothetical protein